MADDEAFPVHRTPADEHLARKLIGCVGCGGIGLAGVAIALVVAAAAFGGFVSGCDIGEIGSPGAGTDTDDLAVTVTPATHLRAGTAVTVTSDAFAASTIVGVAVCLDETTTKARGVAACDEVQGARFAVAPSGHLTATYAVPRVINVGGAVHDCATRAGACVLVAADANDYDHSGGQAISFDATQPRPPDPPVQRAESDHLPIGATPDGAITAGTTLTIIAGGFQPGEPLLLARCTDELDEVGPLVACEPLDPYAAMTAVMLRAVPADAPIADAKGNVTVEVDATAWIVPANGTIPSTEPDGTDGLDHTGPAPSGSVDCAARPGRCSIVIAAAADTKRSAVLPYSLGPR